MILMKQESQKISQQDVHRSSIITPIDLVVDDLLILWEDKYGYMQAFADDVLHLHTARSIDDLYGQVQDTLFEVGHIPWSKI